MLEHAHGHRQEPEHEFEQELWQGYGHKHILWHRHRNARGHEHGHKQDMYDGHELGNGHGHGHSNSWSPVFFLPRNTVSEKQQIRTLTLCPDSWRGMNIRTMIHDVKWIYAHGSLRGVNHCTKFHGAEWFLAPSSWHGVAPDSWRGVNLELGIVSLKVTLLNHSWCGVKLCGAFHEAESHKYSSISLLIRKNRIIFTSKSGSQCYMQKTPDQKSHVTVPSKSEIFRKQTMVYGWLPVLGTVGCCSYDLYSYTTLWTVVTYADL